MRLLECTAPYLAVISGMDGHLFTCSPLSEVADVGGHSIVWAFWHLFGA